MKKTSGKKIKEREDKGVRKGRERKEKRMT